MYLCTYVLVGIYVFLMDLYLGVEYCIISYAYMHLYSILPNCFSVSLTICIPTLHEISSYSSSLPKFEIVCLFHLSHSDVHKVIFHCGFYFHILKDYKIKQIFIYHYSFILLYCEVSIQAL